MYNFWVSWSLKIPIEIAFECWLFGAVKTLNTSIKGWWNRIVRLTKSTLDLWYDIGWIHSTIWPNIDLLGRYIAIFYTLMGGTIFFFRQTSSQISICNFLDDRVFIVRADGIRSFFPWTFVSLSLKQRFFLEKSDESLFFVHCFLYFYLLIINLTNTSLITWILMYTFT